MNRLWWRLPGPSAFVSQIVSDLRDGLNVMLCLPENFPGGLDYAVRSALDDGERFMWRSMDVPTDDKIGVTEFLFSAFAPRSTLAAEQSIESLCREESFIGKIIWLQGLNEGVWPHWRNFLISYEQVCRSVPLVRRTVFVVELAGSLTKTVPDDDVCLSRRAWYGMSSSLDMWIFVSELFQPKVMPDLLKRVSMAVVVNLALWDPVLARRLADADEGALFDPLPMLCQYAKDLGWEPGYTRDGPYAWYNGQMNRVDGDIKPHSAAVAMRDLRKEILRRIWSAQVGILLPFIEERRYEILETLKDVLYVPFTTRFGENITDPKDLEIGHIEAQLAIKGSHAPPQFRIFVSRLREARNALSHLEPLDYYTLLRIGTTDYKGVLKGWNA